MNKFFYYLATLYCMWILPTNVLANPKHLSSSNNIDTVEHQPLSLNCAFTVMPSNSNVFNFVASTNPSNPSGTTYSWNFGNGMTSISILSPPIAYSAQGTYTVCHYAMYNGLTDSCCQTVMVTCPPNNIITLDTAFIGTSPTVLLASLADTTNITSYSWDLGNTTSSYNANQSMVSNFDYPAVGSYPISVTVTNINGLTCTYTDTIMVVQSICVADFDFTPSNPMTVPATVQFNNLSYSLSGSTQNAIQWDFGNMTPIIMMPPFITTYNAFGAYQVTLMVQFTNPYCFASTTKNIVIGNEISGNIYTNSVANDSFLVYLIKYSGIGTNATLTAIDSQYVTGNPASYIFAASNLNDTLYVKAMLLPSSPNYANYLPTYYDTTLFWSSALMVSPTAATPPYHIIMKQGNNPGGAGFVGGFINQGANKMASNGVNKVEILLLNENMKPVTHTATDANGYYHFDNIAFGDYWIYPEVLGKTTIPLAFSLTANTPTLTNQNMIIQHDSIYADISVGNEAAVVSKTYKIYPNPTDNQLTIWIESEVPADYTISLFEVTGKQLLQVPIKVENILTSKLDMTAYAKGYYYLKIGSEKTGFYIEKVFKR